MPLTISNNSAVAFASHYLGENQKKLQTSIKKIASGKRIVGGAEDTAGVEGRTQRRSKYGTKRPKQK